MFLVRSVVDQDVKSATAVVAALLAAAGIERPAAEARMLTAHVAGLDQAGLLREPGRLVDMVALRHLAGRRAAHEPMAYILGSCGFWNLTLSVSPATLIPRADSETLIEAAIAARPDRAVRSILDLGTGTGCLLLAALSEFPVSWGLGIDRVAAAVALAAANAAANLLADRSCFIAADWAAPIGGQFDLILSNPPYIPHADLSGLMPEVAHHEPAGALDGGPDGLDACRTLMAVLPRLMSPGGLAILEFGIGQAQALLAMAQGAGFAADLRADLGGHPRALVLHIA